MKNLLLTLSLLALLPSALAQIPTNSFLVSSTGVAASPNPSQLYRILPDGSLSLIGPVSASDGTQFFDALGYNSANAGSLYAMNARLASPTLFNPIPSPNFYRIDLETGLTRSLGAIEPPAGFSLNPFTGRGTVGVTLNFIGTGGDNANYFVTGLVLDIRVNIFAARLESVSNPRLYVGEINFNSRTPTDPVWRLANTDDPATKAIIDGYVDAINRNPSSPDVSGGPRDWVFVRENDSPTLKSYLGVERQLLTVSNVTTSPVARVTTPSVPIPRSAEIGAMFGGENNVLYAINTDGSLNGGGEIYQLDAATGNYLNVTLNTGLGLFRGDATTVPPTRPLPVTLTSFTARAERASVALRWATATEEGTDLFRVERSTDEGQTWAPIGDVKAANAPQGRQYAFVDEAPQNGLNYYRLLILDFDGSVAYSPVQSADFQPTQGTLTVYPNPAQDQFVIELPQVAGADNSLRVLNSLGQQVWEQGLEGKRTVRVPTQSWAAGVYHVQVQTNGRTQTQRLVVRP